METRKEGKEQLEKEVTEEKKGSSTQGVDDPMTKISIRETIISDSSDTGGPEENKQVGVQDPDDVLAFSRSVHKIDSSLDENLRTAVQIFLIKSEKKGPKTPLLAISTKTPTSRPNPSSHWKQLMHGT
ncbi:hypothetical protein SADUNF_Sadunf06G0055300 [Salix dunnii]|uniref:Uncharacterized protein n=1 Tax=Salix dunnii TaxID=1413687 RepID=A0A835K385_9ROSI|nr:hypothetical protein SADUNF_Sadunf06G0055300 [Salix dunnii]